jgi:hypothetical protein
MDFTKFLLMKQQRDLQAHLKVHNTGEETFQSYKGQEVTCKHAVRVAGGSSRRQ